MENSEIFRKLAVREMSEEDINLVVDYWLKSYSDFLVSLGVDLTKLPERDNLVAMLRRELGLPYSKKQSLALIWEMDGEAIGHCNINGIWGGGNNAPPFVETAHQKKRNWIFSG